MSAEHSAHRASTTKRSGKPKRPTPPAPPQAVMGLLNYLTATSMDEDYAEASSRRSDHEREATRRPGTMALVVLAVFGILVATAAIQTSRGAEDAQSSHDELVKQINARKDQLGQRQDRIRELEEQNDQLQSQFLTATTQGRSLSSRLSRLGLASGAVAAQGPGVTVIVDNGPRGAGDDAEVLDLDLQKLVNGLWLAGAEQIAINSQRLTSLSAIRIAGANITVNLRPVSRPYTVRAIGNPDTLAASFIDTPGGQWWLDLKALYGLRFDIKRAESLTLPAANRLELRHAHRPETSK